MSFSIKWVPETDFFLIQGEIFLLSDMLEKESTSFLESIKFFFKLLLENASYWFFFI